MFQPDFTDHKGPITAALTDRGMTVVTNVSHLYALKERQDGTMQRVDVHITMLNKLILNVSTYNEYDQIEDVTEEYFINTRDAVDYINETITD